MKKMYNQPKTDVTAFETARLMQDIVVSVNQGGGGGVAGAPAVRGGNEITE